MSRCYFVTGTDIEVGETAASYASLQAIKAAGYRTVGYKSMASGSKKTPKGLRNSDALVLQHNSSLQLDYATVDLYTFTEPASSHIIGAQEGRPIKAPVTNARLRALEQQADWVLVEGVGSWFTPLSDTLALANWVIQEQLSVTPVVGVRFGCTNHAMLTAQVVLHAGLTLVGWVMNDVTSPEKRHVEYMATLTRMIPAPLLSETP